MADDVYFSYNHGSSVFSFSLCISWSISISGLFVFTMISSSKYLPFNLCFGWRYFIVPFVRTIQGYSPFSWNSLIFENVYLLTLNWTKNVYYSSPGLPKGEYLRMLLKIFQPLAQVLIGEIWGSLCSHLCELFFLPDGPKN